MTDFEKTIAYALDDKDLKSSEIPSIDLYLDQIINLVADKNAQGSPMFSDRVLTKTMINNYSKDGLIMPIKGKKYSKEHIIQMLLVYSLKNTISIGSIKRILQGIYHESVGFDSERLKSGYDRYIETKEQNVKRSRDIVDAFIKDNGFNIENDDDFFTFLLGLISLSADLKNISIALLEEKYPDYDALIRAEAEAEKSKREQYEKAEKENKKAKKKAVKEETKKNKESEKAK